MVFVGITTLTAGYMNITNIYLPQITNAGKQAQGLINLMLTLIIMIAVLIIFIDAVPKWIRVISGKQPLVIETSD